MQSATRLTLLLCAAWAAALLYGEMGAYWASYLACSWPSSSSFSSPPVSAWLAVLGIFWHGGYADCKSLFWIQKSALRRLS